MKNKQKGFTLIELLAVIVILAIIALIATPIILGVITKGEKTTKGDAAPTKPSGGVATILPSGLTKGSAVYFNPETKKTCEESEAVSTTGIRIGCMKWYVYKDNENGTYQLILDHNTTTGVRWSTTSTNDTNGDAVNAQLATDTTDWDSSLKARLITADEIAEITGANSNDTIKWSSSKTYGTTIETQSAWFYLDGGKNTNKTSYSTTDGWQKQYANSTIKSDYAWLFDRTAGCAAYGCNVADASNFGYWTSTPVVGITDYAWYVIGYGRLSGGSVDYGYLCGVRPVITV